VEPPFYRFFGYQRWHYPVTLALVGTYLKGLGHDVAIYDADLPDAGCRSLSRQETRQQYARYGQALDDPGHPIWGEIRRVIRDRRPEVVGITSISPKIESADLVARMVREELPEARIILGGAHALAMRDMDPGYDFGPWYDEVVVHIPNLVDQRPDKKLLLDYDLYPAKDLSSILTLSGCPMQCTFCCRSFDRTFIYRDLGSVREELEEIAGYPGHSGVYVMDDCFFSHGERFDRMTAMMRELDLPFVAGGRIMALTPGKLEQFRERGGSKLLVGVESGSQRILDRVKKKLRVEEIVRRCAWINREGIPWSAFLVVGFPFETMDDLEMTEELIYRIRPTFISVNRFTPYPGTEIFREFYADAGLRFRDLFQLNCNVLPGADPAMEEKIDRLFEDFDRYNEERRREGEGRA
jgi:hypothetical protein